MSFVIILFEKSCQTRPDILASLYLHFEISTMLQKIKIDRFVLGIIISVILAYILPQLGAKDSPVPLDTIGSIGISLIFFFYGLSLENEAIQNGLKDWNLHITVQAS